MEMRFVRIASLDKLAAHYNLPRLCLSAFRADCIVDACRFYERYTIFASARFVRIASAKLHRYCAANLWNTL